MIKINNNIRFTTSLMQTIITITDCPDFDKLQCNSVIYLVLLIPRCRQKIIRNI